MVIILLLTSQQFDNQYTGQMSITSDRDFDGWDDSEEIKAGTDPDNFSHYPGSEPDFIESLMERVHEWNFERKLREIGEVQ